MSEQEVSDSLQRIDFWSRYVALFFALIAYTALLFSIKEGILSAILAATTAIGLRIGIPYYAILTRYRQDDGSGPALPGNVHHGSLSISLLLAPLVALGAILVQPNVNVAYAAGIATAVTSYFPLSYLLPRL